MASIYRSVIADPTNFLTVDASGIRFMLPVDDAFTTFLAFLAADGIKKTVNKGVSFGSTYGTGQGGSWLSGMRLPRNIGAAPEGRLILVPYAAGLATNKVYISDDEGATTTQKTVTGSVVNERGTTPILLDNDTILMRRLYNTGGNAGIDKTVDGGDVWTNTVLSGNRYGFSLNRLTGGSAYYHFLSSTTGTALNFNKTSDGTSWGSTVLGFTLPAANVSGRYPRGAHHEGDDTIGIATVLAGDEFVFIRMNNAELHTQRFLSSTGGNIDYVDWVSAVPGLPDTWVITVRTNDGNTQWWWCNGDSTSFSILKTQALVGGGLGALSNAVQFGV